MIGDTTCWSWLCPCISKCILTLDRIVIGFCGKLYKFAQILKTYDLPILVSTLYYVFAPLRLEVVGNFWTTDGMFGE